MLGFRYGRRLVLELQFGKILILILVLIGFDNTWAQVGPSAVRLSKHVPHRAIAGAVHLGRAPDQKMKLTFALAARDEAGMRRLIARQADAKDKMYGHYLTPNEVLNQFGPSPEDVLAVKNELLALGLTVTDTNGNLLRAEGRLRTIENAFSIEIHNYQTAEGRLAFALNNEPLVSPALASRLYSISGLENIVRAHHHAQILNATARPLTIGTGPQGGLAPADFIKAYGMAAPALTGTGQSLALYELDGYTASDIAAYAKLFNLALTPPLQNILVDNFSGAPGAGAVEVTLDIELMAAAAPGAAKILVYEGPNTAQGALDTMAKIANDNLAAQVSTSWGLDEAGDGAAAIKAENLIFMQMALQGQTVFAAAGDSGAFDNGTTLSVDDPAAQPYVTGVGGTTLALNAADQSYKSESSWSTPAAGKTAASGGGGGVSSVWTMPAYQAGVGNSTNLGSNTMRMVPDVALNANPATGYSIFFGGKSVIVGGTSCAAPLWAAMTALINEKRAMVNLPKLGFANPALYQVGQSSLSSQTFHDVNDGSTNLKYPAVTGYDLSTGFGSPNFANLFNALVSPVLPPLPPSLTVVPHNKLLTLNWSASVGSNTYALYRSTASAGPFVALSTTLTSPLYIDLNLTDATTYYYYVTATDAAGVSGSSPTVSATPALVVPQAPTNLTFIVVPK